MENQLLENPIFHSLQSRLIDYGLNEKSISPKASLSNDLGLDSLDFAELIMDMENTFDIPIPYDKVERNCKTVEDLVKIIEGELKTSSSLMKTNKNPS